MTPLTAIDLFAGCGGSTTGAQAAGVRVLWAANHWQAAVDIHRANHPGVEHSCQDLHQADWSAVPGMDVVLASPACQGHSKARGQDRPHHDRDRATAWAVVSCAEFHRPKFIVVENVPEFRRWRLYPAWRCSLEMLGYALSEEILNASACGVPQDRRRLFIIGARGRVPFTVVAPNHPPAPASSFINFSVGRWSKVFRPGRADSTVARWRDGHARFGDRFVMSFYGNTLTARSIDRPIGTMTTRDRWAVVNGDRMRMLTVDECRAGMGFPADYILPANHRLAVHLLGNAVCPAVEEHVLAQLRRAA